jgi:glycosyltransferase involved in cell wall biosynthesis
MTNCGGVFVVDEEGSPLWRAAQSHARRSGSRVLAANRYYSIVALTREVLKVPTSFLIFTWRGAFDSFLQSKRARQMLCNKHVSIFLLIPDLIGIHQESEMEQSRINYADGLLVTSEELFNRYSEVYELRSIQILHDFPPIEALEKATKFAVARDSRKIIWVGNSKWGERAGFVDHKGLQTFALPIFRELQKSWNDLSLTVIDSAFKRLSYEEVLRQIANSSCLIFTSESEGTGLPMIEAAALGTPLVTFNVGIAPELLQDELAVLISPKDIGQFVGKVSYVLKNVEDVSKKIVDASDKYMVRILSDLERLKLEGVDVGSWRNQALPRNWKNFLLWKYRWLRNLSTRLIVR